MQSMGVQAVLVVLVLFISTVKAAEGGVRFSRETVTLTCPKEGKWHSKKGEITEAQGTKDYEFTYEGKAQYSCIYDDDDGDQAYLFYVEGKTCKNCFELDAFTFGVAIVADVAVTALVMFVVYKCTKKKGSAGPAHPSKPPARSGGRGPPVPSPDYERLNPNTRAEGPYSVVNRTG